MSLSLDFEWLPPEAAKGAELRATWAGLRITVSSPEGDECITRLFDSGSRTIRDQVWLPLYVVAEWIAFNWYPLLHGTGQNRREEEHNLRFARDGYALPWLSIIPEGDVVRLTWSRHDPPSTRVNFLNEGSAIVSLLELEAALSGFVQAVVDRLASEGVWGTPVQVEWEALQGQSDDEREFCAAAASLGLDPFDVTEACAATIVEAAETLGQDVLAEAFPLLSPETVAEDATCIRRALDELEGMQSSIGRLLSIRSKLGLSQLGVPPWQVGQALARVVREHLGLPPGPISRDELAALVNPSPFAGTPLPSVIQGGVRVNGSTGAVAVGTQLSGAAEKFLLARLACECVTARGGSSSIVTKGWTARQKMNRAFAAELLAPAGELGTRLANGRVADEQVEELAEYYGVSPLLVEHQIRNNKLAAIQRSV